MDTMVVMVSTAVMVVVVVDLAKPDKMVLVIQEVERMLVVMVIQHL